MAIASLFHHESLLRNGYDNDNDNGDGDNDCGDGDVTTTMPMIINLQL